MYKLKVFSLQVHMQVGISLYHLMGLSLSGDMDMHHFFTITKYSTCRVLFCVHSLIQLYVQGGQNSEIVFSDLWMLEIHVPEVK